LYYVLCWQHSQFFFSFFFFCILPGALLTEITDSLTRWEVTSPQIRFVIFAVHFVMCNSSSFRHKQIAFCTNPSYLCHRLL
jgi:hypothetical protein